MPADILNFWFLSPDGCLNEESVLMYLVTTPYMHIKPVQACLTSFAVQIMKWHLIQEATNATQPSSGLHAIVSHRTSMKKAEWVNIGATTVPEVVGILKRHQPSHGIILPKLWLKNLVCLCRGVVSIRKHRPIDVVSWYHSESDGNNL